MSAHLRGAWLAFVVLVAVEGGCPARRGEDPPESDVRGSGSAGPDVAPGVDAPPPGLERDESDRVRESLQVEERDSDSRSEMVTIKVMVDRPKCAHVFWGAKDLGEAPLEIRRPRGSGPMDLLVRCAGMLTVHTRVFTDRDDRIAVHLFREDEAASVFGYRPLGR